MSPDKGISSPWREFLHEVDASLAQRVALYCMGGFVLTLWYHLPRVTGDLDFYTAVPQECLSALEKIAGEGSALAKKYKLHVHHVTVSAMPDQFEERAEQMFSGTFRQLHLYAPDPYDLILSKLERNSPKDIADLRYLAKARGLRPELLRARYENDLRPYLLNPGREDLTLRLWIESGFGI